MTNPDIETIVNLARNLMDGQQPPPAGPKLELIANAVRELTKQNSTAAWELLGLTLFGVLIERVCSDLAAQQALEKFIRGGDHA